MPTQSRVRFRRLDDIPLDVIGEAVGRVPADAYIGFYEAGRGARAPRA